MNNLTKENKLLTAWLEEEKFAFSGWDFSHINDRHVSDDLPWDYYTIVRDYLKPDMLLLDIGTGGGEFLLTLKHPFKNTSVTEAYPPNIELCKKVLSPLGITVYPVEDEQLKDVPDANFDIVINRHESYDPKMVSRILKPGGIFITQQVGAYNNKDLATFFDCNHVDQFPNCRLDNFVADLKNNNFNILFFEEAFPKLRFFDVAAIVYFAKIITWEFLNFSVRENIQKLEQLQAQIEEKGFIESTEHRFVIVAKKAN